jgi:actin-related protein 6
MSPYGNLWDPNNAMAFESLFPDPSSSPRSPSPDTDTLAGPPQCSLLVDTSFSFTHITPIINGVPIAPCTRRIDIGGKLLTNLLAQQISFRQWNVMDEWSVVEEVKDSGTSFVAGSREEYSKLLELCKCVYFFLCW